MIRKRRKPVTVRISTERMGLPFPFSAFPFPNFDDEDDEEEISPVPNGELPDPETADGGTPPEEDGGQDGEIEPERSEFFAEGRMVADDSRVEIVYEESLLTGMAGSVTTIGFDRSDPSVVSMYRQGLVDTSLVFEEGKRHISVYTTPFGAFELCVHALTVRNNLLESGTIELDYLTDLRGARTERCKMKIRVE